MKCNLKHFNLEVEDWLTCLVLFLLVQIERVNYLCKAFDDGT